MAPARPAPVEPPPLLAVEDAGAPALREAVQSPRPVEAPAAAPAPVQVTPPQFDAAYLRNPPPPYPLASRRMREQGKVLLRVHVSAGGDAEQVLIDGSSGHPRLDESAREAVRAWRFAPARQGGRAVAAWVIVPIRFALEE
jgi:protein TonB